jgi:1,4-dihydroxy-2-naphthoate octaprenyltransferase
LNESIIEAGKVKTMANLSAVFVIIIGLTIYFGFNTGIWTLPLGAFGLASGYFYSVPPFRWVKRGIGEILIGICYGYLPVFVASYLQSGVFYPELFLVGTPIAISIFLVIFINEFPDYQADTETGKWNIVARLGRKKSSYIYIFGQLLFIASMLLIYSFVINNPGFWLLLPVVLSLIQIILVAKGYYNNKNVIEIICGTTIVLNLGTSLVLILASL